VPALLWSAGITLLDGHLLFRGTPGDESARLASVRMDPSCVTGLTFGLCGFLGARADHKYGHVFLYAVVGCLACVLPSHNLEKGSIEEQLIESVQKTVLVGCISLVIAGVGLARLAPSAADEKNPPVAP
jgi:hypothetical protein